MHRYIPILAITMILSVVRADEPASGLASFQFEGIRFSTTVAEFQRHFPMSRLVAQHCDAKAGIQCYVAIGAKAADGVMAYFLDGRLYKIEVMYSAENIDRMGGLDTMAKKLRTKFGMPTNAHQLEAAVKFTWNEPLSSRRAELSATATAVLLSVIDTGRETVVQERRAANIDLGF